MGKMPCFGIYQSDAVRKGSTRKGAAFDMRNVI